jgi:Flp pilus assembly pilin Flp
MLGTIRTVLADLHRDEEGATLVEYILLAVLIGIAAIVGMTFLGRVANNRLNNVATVIE